MTAVKSATIMIKTFSRAFSFVILTTLLGASAWGAIHPVPLDAKPDPEICVQCHSDKTEGKHVHTAIAMGCLTCHEVRVSRGVTRVKLITTTPAKLCLTCHSDKDASTIKGKVHPPAVRDCVKCHSPHTSDYENQLLKPLSGSTKDDNLCLGCHTDKAGDAPKGGSRHPALDMGCDACHITHKTGEKGVREFDYHLKKDAPALCQDCHDVKDADLIKAHAGQPFGTADCLECHDPHKSNSPHLLAKFTHPPFAEGGCDTCHQAPKEKGKVGLNAATPKELCVMCHSDKPDEIEKAKVQHPGAMGDCTDCHSPHAGRYPYFPKPNPVEVCTSCHADMADLGKKAHPHAAAFKSGCGICHNPHGNDNAHLLRISDPNKLCLQCHGPDSKPANLPAQHVITIFDGKVKLPEDYFQKERVVILPLQYGKGHPIQGHPVTDVMDPKDIHKVLKKINCLTCHQPHSSAQPFLLVKDQANGSLFCASCHTNLTGK